MRRRPSCQKTIMIAYFRFPIWLSRNKEVGEKKQRRTRAAQQRELSTRCAPQRRPAGLTHHDACQPVATKLIAIELMETRPNCADGRHHGPHPPRQSCDD